MNKRTLALGRLKAGVMNKTEEAYSWYLEGLKVNGAILSWKFEAIKLRLAANTFYTPDFMVIDRDRVMEMHEVKGFWQDDARVKIKVAAELFPFRFLAIKKGKGGVWEVEKF